MVAEAWQTGKAENSTRSRKTSEEYVDHLCFNTIHAIATSASYLAGSHARVASNLGKVLGEVADNVLQLALNLLGKSTLLFNLGEKIRLVALEAAKMSVSFSSDCVFNTYWAMKSDSHCKILPTGTLSR